VHGLILAGGEGSRLAADGLTTPKPLVDVAGRPQLVRLVEQFAALGCETITCMLRDDAYEYLQRATTVARRIDSFATVVRCQTPSSLHTFVEGLARVPAGNVFASMVDSVMLPNDWRAVYDGAVRYLASAADAVLAVTPALGDDDSPLWVTSDDAHRVVAVGREPGSPAARRWVTGGVYAFAPSARVRAQSTLASGLDRMRIFLGDLVDSGARVMAVEVPYMIDVDHRQDLEKANSYLTSMTEPTPAVKGS